LYFTLKGPLHPLFNQAGTNRIFDHGQKIPFANAAPAIFETSAPSTNNFSGFSPTGKDFRKAAAVSQTNERDQALRYNGQQKCFLSGLRGQIV
jgi:hypothetical protein